MKRSDLSPRQLDVANATDDRILVTGGAGTGKTTVALWAARTELERPGNEKKRALFLTFSRTAVDQIIARSRAVVAPVENRIEVSTFHSFAYRLVRRFGHLAGVTGPDPTVQSASEVKLLGKDDERLVYDDLAPLALKVLNDPRVAALFAERWCIVICDEFQDTGDAQWGLLEWVSDHTRLLLLGDEHQLIFGFLAPSGVGPQRMTAARAWVDRTVELEAASHRDPTGAIPAFATAILHRRFNDPAILSALEEGRLHIQGGVESESIITSIGSALDAAFGRGCRTFGVFAHSNESVASLSLELHQAGIDHYLVGLPDAEADALTAMLALTRFAYAEAGWDEVGVAFGTYLTACTRGRTPDLAKAFANDWALPSGLQARVASLQDTLEEAATRSFQDVAGIVATAWPSLGITRGDAPWNRSAPSFQALARESARDPATQTARLAKALAQLRAGAMFDSQRRRLPAVQVMNLHQTKGREADAVVVVCSDDDYLGDETEPFPDGSRLLYVILTRARQEVTMIFGDEPHPLVAPISRLA